MTQSSENIVHLGARTKRVCESCGNRATVKLEDGSAWCDACDGAARRNGY
jgi:hypothetical protein